MPISPCPPPASRGRRGPAAMRLATSTSSSSSDQRRTTRARPRAAVLERVGQALLHEAEGGQVDAGRQRPRVALHAQLDRRAPRRASGAMSAPRRSSEGCGECSASSPSGRRMPSSRRISVSASRPVASTAPSARDRGVGVAVEHAARRAGLHDHDRDRVRDDVVQLARDPHALARHGVALALGALALELLGARPSARRSGARGRGRRAPAPSSRGTARRGRSTSPTVWSGRAP